jgi:hypothetical protein
MRSSAVTAQLPRVTCKISSTTSLSLKGRFASKYASPLHAAQCGEGCFNRILLIVGHCRAAAQIPAAESRARPEFRFLEIR